MTDALAALMLKAVPTASPINVRGLIRALPRPG
jgi:hypothetical protein